MFMEIPGTVEGPWWLPSTSSPLPTALGLESLLPILRRDRTSLKSRNENIFNIQVRIGDHDFASTGEGSLPEMTIDVASFTNHEDYASVSEGNDITIIELAQEVDLATFTPACLAKSSDTNTFDGKNAWVYGEIMRN